MADEPGGPPPEGGGKRILGMKPTTAYLVFGSALLVGILAYIIKQRQASKQAAESGATSAATPATVAGDIDYSGQLSVIQTELEAVLAGQGQGSTSGGGGGGGSWGNGGGSWGGGGGDSGGGDSGGGSGSTGGGTNGGGGAAGGGSASSGGGSSNAAPAAPSGGHVVSTTATGAVIAWNGNGAAKWKVVITGPGAINGHTATVGIPQATYSGLESGHNYEVTVTPLSASGTPGPSGTVHFVTK